MRLTFYVALYISSISSLENQKHSDKLAVKVDKSTLNLKFIEDDESISAIMKIQDYIARQAAAWYSENKMIDLTSFFIDGVEVGIWEAKFLDDSDKKAGINRFCDEIPNRIVEFKINKYKLKNKNNPIQFQLDLLAIDIYRSTMVQYYDEMRFAIPSNESYKNVITYIMQKKIDLNKISYVITFNDISNGIPTNLDNYEIIAYKSNVEEYAHKSEVTNEGTYSKTRTSNNEETFSSPSIVFKNAIDVILNMLFTVGIFGSLILAGRYSLSKYF